MGCCHSRDKAFLEAERQIATPSFVIGTAVVDSVFTEPNEEEELFRSGDIVVARVHTSKKDETRLSYRIAHGKAQATFCNQAALVEAFISELRAHYVMDVACTATVAVTNSIGVHLTHVYLWKEASPHNDEVATSKLINMLHSFPSPAGETRDVSAVAHETMSLDEAYHE